MARVSNRIQKMLCATGCRASTVFSNVHGKAASVILGAKLRHAPDLALVIQNNCKRLRCSAKEIYSALNFEIETQIAINFWQRSKSFCGCKNTTTSRLNDSVNYNNPMNTM